MEYLPKDIFGIIFTHLVETERLYMAALLGQTCKRIQGISTEYITAKSIVKYRIEKSKTVLDKSLEPSALRLLTRYGMKWQPTLIREIYFSYPKVLDSYLPVHDNILRHLVEKNSLNIVELIEVYYINVVEKNGIRTHYNKEEMSTYAGLSRLCRILSNNLKDKTIIDKRGSCVTPLYLPSLTRENIVYIYDRTSSIPSRADLS